MNDNQWPSTVNNSIYAVTPEQLELLQRHASKVAEWVITESSSSDTKAYVANKYAELVNNVQSGQYTAVRRNVAQLVEFFNTPTPEVSRPIVRRIQLKLEQMETIANEIRDYGVKG